ncbi:aminopeptidase P family protein [Alcaligenaceae bacterium]|nr:aminopeptidase P family protein [Alcaligenaceae bacterium]
MNKSVFIQRLQALRAAMLAHQVQACVVLSSDPHLSEYLPEHWQARQWLSGFEGSAGTLVVTADQAGLWTDSRYWEQAAIDLKGTDIAVMRAGAPDVLPPAEWLAATLPVNASVAVDGRTLALHTLRLWSDPLAKQSLVLRHDIDLPGVIWSQRPALPHSPVYEHLPPFACRSRADNLAAVRAAMHEKQADWHWISALDEIAWLFNLRGSDVPYNPVFLAHALIGQDSAILFVGEGKVGTALQDALLHDGVKVEPYDQAITALANVSDQQTLLLDPARTTIAMQAAATARQIEALNPIQLLKSQKTDQEAQHVRRAMEQDGAALCQFFAWLEVALDSPEVVTELTVDQEITRARSQRNGFVSPSFSTIAAFNANGAMPHYSASESAHAVIEGDGLLLIDSGGQYLGGTTDITRMVAIGQVNPQQQHDCTVVLKGMMALSQVAFPSGTPAPLLDTVARMPIWQAGADYGHGTGHGVGYFLNVHEGPQSISYRTPATPQTAMLAGMITSNEPGLYRPGQWGVRIENLVLAVPDVSTEFGDFLKFETLTLCPIDTRCLNVDMLSANERAWLNNYHAQVRERLMPLVDGMAADWLVERTLPV